MKKTTQQPKVVIVMPAYNAELTLADTFHEIPKKFLHHVILVDDQSKDNTVHIAKKLGVTVIKRKKNGGYGANQKTCYKAALKLKPDIIAMLHADYQYSAEKLPELIQPIADGKYDFMFGSRISTRRGALEGGMPKLKYFTNRFFAVLQNILLGVNFSEHFSGFRAYSAKLLQTLPFEQFSDDFLFDQHMTLSALSHNFRIGEIPIPTRYDEKSSQMSLQKGAKFIIETFHLLALYLLHQYGVTSSSLFAKKKKKRAA